MGDLSDDDVFHAVCAQILRSRKRKWREYDSNAKAEWIFPQK